MCCNQIRPSQSIKIKIYRLFQIHLVFRRFLIKCNRFIVLISLSWLLHKTHYNESWVILIYKLIEDLTTYLFGIIKVRKEKACLMGVWGMVTWRGDQFHELFYAEAEVILNLWTDQMQYCKINGWIINSKNLAQIFVFVLLTWAYRQFLSFQALAYMNFSYFCKFSLNKSNISIDLSLPKTKIIEQNFYGENGAKLLLNSI